MSDVPIDLPTLFTCIIGALIVYDLMSWLVSLVLWSFFPELRGGKNAD